MGSSMGRRVACDWPAVGVLALLAWYGCAQRPDHMSSEKDSGRSARQIMVLPSDPNVEVLGVAISNAMSGDRIQYSLSANGALRVEHENGWGPPVIKSALVSLPPAQVLRVLKSIVTSHNIEQPAPAIQREFGTLMCGDNDGSCVQVVITLQGYEHGAYYESPLHRRWGAAYPGARDVIRIADAGARQSYGSLERVLEELESVTPKESR